MKLQMTKMATSPVAVHTHTQVILNKTNKVIHKWESYLLVYVFAVSKNYARDG